MQIPGVLGQLQRVHGPGVLAGAVLFADPSAGADRLCAALTPGDDLGVVARMTHIRDGTPSRLGRPALAFVENSAQAGAVG